MDNMKISPWAQFLVRTAIAVAIPSASFSQRPPSSTVFVNNLMPQPATLIASSGSFLLTPQFSAGTTRCTAIVSLLLVPAETRYTPQEKSDTDPAQRFESKIRCRTDIPRSSVLSGPYHTVGWVPLHWLHALGEQPPEKCSQQAPRRR